MSRHTPWPTRILAAVDFDDTAGAALSHARWWALQYGAPLVVLHVGGEAPPTSRATLSELRGLVESVVPPDDPQPELLVRTGRPGQEIAAVAASTGADLIVTGTHGRGLVGRWALGSVASELLRTADAPVLLVHGPDVGYAGAVVAAVDLSEASAGVIRRAGEVAAARGVPLRLLHALPIGDHPSAGHVVMHDTATHSLEQLRAQHVPPTVATKVHVAMRMENPATAIAHDADSHQAALIVTGGHGASGWTRGVLGRVTERLLHETSVPVLVVRAAQA